MLGRFGKKILIAATTAASTGIAGVTTYKTHQILPPQQRKAGQNPHMMFGTRFIHEDQSPRLATGTPSKSPGLRRGSEE